MAKGEHTSPPAARAASNVLQNVRSGRAAHADVESDQRRQRFTDPRLSRTTIDEWIRV